MMTFFGLGHEKMVLTIKIGPEKKIGLDHKNWS
jgi:hypothetical protein